VAVWGEASSAAILWQHCGRHGLLQHVTGLLEFWLQGFFSRPLENRVRRLHLISGRQLF